MRDGSSSTKAPKHAEMHKLEPVEASSVGRIVQECLDQRNAPLQQVEASSVGRIVQECLDQRNSPLQQEIGVHTGRRIEPVRTWLTEKSTIGILFGTASACYVSVEVVDTIFGSESAAATAMRVVFALNAMLMDASLWLSMSPYVLRRLIVRARYALHAICNTKTARPAMGLSLCAASFIFWRWCVLRNACT